MLNIIKADIYRLLRGKGFYITFGILLAFVALVVFTSAEVTIGVQTEMNDNLNQNGDTPIVYNGKNIASILYTTMDGMAYFLLPLIILVTAPMFSHGAVKNGLSYGMSRSKLYFSKLILSSVLCVMLVVGYILFGVLLATLLRGFGGAVTTEYWVNLLKVCGSQLFMMLALTCIGVFLVFATKRTAMVNGIYIALTTVPIIIISLLYGIDERFIKLNDYDVIGNIKKFAYIDALSNAEISKAFLVGAFYMVTATILGIVIFKKSEIK